MKKTILTLIAILGVIAMSNAQEIEMQKAFGGYKYTYNGRVMTMRNLVQLMESNQESYKLIKKAQSNLSVASIFGGVGGFLVGWPLGTAIGGGEPNWTLAGVGAGFFLISIPFASNANKGMKQAVELYNSSLDATTFYKRKPEFNFVANGNGIGIAMRF